MDIHAVSAYGAGAASARVRLFDWFTHLNMSPTFHSYRGTSSNRPREMIKDFRGVVSAERVVRCLDVVGSPVVISREASPLSRGDVECKILRDASRGVYDFDDALFHDISSSRRLGNLADKCRRATRSADTVIVGNDYLADWASRHASDVRVIPSCVEPANYLPKMSWAITGPVPRIVWLGSPSTEQFVRDIAPSLLEVHARSGAELVLISGPTDNAELGSLTPMITRVPWSPDGAAAVLRTADLAIAPLSDTLYARGKCAYKLLQYAASGLPIVGSPVGSNRLALQRFQGVPVEQSEDWADAIMSLVDSSQDRRRRMGEKGGRAVREHYSFSAWAEDWRGAVLG